jgi:3-phenylpropionate/trans-cinnamate dioxygenase ferredoxin reductase subunit
MCDRRTRNLAWEAVSLLEQIVLVGGGVAAHACLKTLRQAGYDGRLVLIAAEPDPPYDRPPLSKKFLLGEAEAADVLLAAPATYRELDVDLRLSTRATGVEDRRLRLDSGERLPFDRLFVATGSRLRRLAVPGGDLEGVHYLRTLDDARRLRAALAAAGRVAVVGGGFIGSEVAAVARTLGKAVVLLEMEALPFERILGPDAARIIVREHERHGVEVRTRARADRFVEGGGRLAAVGLADGSTVACDVAVVGVGVEPEVDWLAGSVELARGVTVDATLRTSRPDVLAGGDVAVFPYRGRPIRIEHWENARRQGEHAARVLLGDLRPYDEVPYFWSDQYDRTYQYFGHVERWDATVVRGDPEAGAAIVFYLVDGRVAAAFLAGQNREALPVRRLVARQARVEPELLGDPDVSLRDLARRPDEP